MKVKLELDILRGGRRTLMGHVVGIICRDKWSDSY